MTQTYKYLHFISFQSLVNWSVAHLLNRDLGFTKHYPFIRIGDVLCRSALPVTIEDNILYTQVTLKTNGGGAVLRDKKLGKDIGTKKQYLAKEGQFIMSKIDARNGAFGIITKELKGAVVTGDFPLFDVDANKINPTYLYLLSSTQPFVQYAQSCSRGTTNRQRIDIDAFLSLQIPLPSLDEQNNIVAAYNSTLAQSALYARQAQDIDAQIEAYLQEKLGFNVNINKKTSLLNFVNYIDLSRWDPHFLLSQHKIGARYPLLSMGDVLSHFLTDKEGKSLRRETTKAPQQKFQYIGMENIEKNTGRIIDSPTVNGSDIKSQTMSVPNGYFLYGKLRPYLNKYWYNNNTLNDNIVCSSEFFVFDIKENIMNKQYFLSVLASYIVQKQLADAMSGARMPRITEDTFRSIQIPLPPLDIQNEIVSHITSLRTEQKALQQQSLSLRSAAQHQFTQTIFN